MILWTVILLCNSLVERTAVGVNYIESIVAVLFCFFNELNVILLL